MTVPNNRKPMGVVVGEMAKVYSYTKMGILAYQAGKRAYDRGASAEEVAKAGLVAAFAWAAVFFGTPWLVLVLIWIFSIPFQHYLVPKQFGNGGRQSLMDISHLHMWLVFGTAGIMSAYFLIVAWTVLYSRMKNTIASQKRGRIYRFGFRQDCKHFKQWHVGALIAAMFVSLMPYHYLLYI